jgi:hypothetical protein
MASTINASSTGSGGLISTGDASGEIELQANGSTKLAVTASGVAVTGTLSTTGGIPSPLTVAGNSTAGAELRLPEDTDNGSNYVALKAADSIASNVTFTLPSADGTSGQVLQTNGSGTLSFGTISASFTLGTPVASTSGTSITFTGIPSGVKQIIIMLNEVSTDGSDPLCIRIGDSGGIETSGYSAFVASIGNSNTTQTGSSGNSYQIESALPAGSGNTRSGNIVLNLQDSSDYTWVLSGTIKGSGPYVSVSAGRKSLSAVLDRVSVSSTSTFNSFSAGEINIMYI